MQGAVLIYKINNSIVAKNNPVTISINKTLLTNKTYAYCIILMLRLNLCSTLTKLVLIRRIVWIKRVKTRM